MFPTSYQYADLNAQRYSDMNIVRLCSSGRTAMKIAFCFSPHMNWTKVLFRISDNYVYMHIILYIVIHILIKTILLDV